MGNFGCPGGRPRAVRVPAGIVNVDPFSYNRFEERQRGQRATTVAVQRGSDYRLSWNFEFAQQRRRQESVLKPHYLVEYNLNKPLPPTPTPRVDPELHYFDIATPRGSIIAANTDSYCQQLGVPSGSESNMSNFSHIRTSNCSSLRRKAPVYDLRKQASVSNKFSSQLPSRMVSTHTASTKASTDPWIAVADYDSGYSTGTERGTSRRRPSIRSSGTSFSPFPSRSMNSQKTSFLSPSMESSMRRSSIETQSPSLPRPSIESSALSRTTTLPIDRLANATPRLYVGHDQWTLEHEMKSKRSNNPRLSDNDVVFGEPLSSAFSWSDDGRDDGWQKVKDGVRRMRERWGHHRRS